jgi:hypothetical protein
MRSFIICMIHIRVIKSMEMRWAGHTAHTGENAYKVTNLKLSGKQRRCRYDNIKMDLRRPAYEIMDKIKIDQGDFVNTVMTNKIIGKQ